MSKNVLQQITPDKPKVLAEERVFVYMPNATETQKGAAKFFARDFAAPLGEVKLRWPTEMLVTQLANPLSRPSFVKVLSDEFKNTLAVSKLTHPTKPEYEYQSTGAEIKLNRDNRNAFTRPELVMLNNGDFEAEVVGTYNKYRIKRLNPLETPALIQVDQNDFSREDGIVKLNWPLAHDPVSGSSRANGFGLVKVDTVNGALKFSAENKLQVDKDLLETELAAAIVPLITKTTIGLGNLENKNFTTREYSEFSANMKLHFTTEFGKKVDKTVYNIDKGQLEDDIEVIAGETSEIRNIINALRFFLGFFPTSTDLEAAYPASEDISGSLAFIGATNTYWAVQYNVDTWEWFDTELVALNFVQFVETDPDELQPNGLVPSVGTSGKWINSDHVHPIDETRAAAAHEIEITSVAPDEGDFIIKLNQPSVNIPFVRTAQFLHNWKNNTGQFTQDTNSNAAYWAGSAAEFESALPGDLPPGSLFVVEDDEIEEAGDLVLTDIMNQIGITVPERGSKHAEQFVIAIVGQELDGLPMTIETIPFNNPTGERRLIQPIDFGDDLTSSERMVVLKSDGKLGKKVFTPNRLVRVDSNGNLVDSALIYDKIIEADSNLVTGEVVIAAGNKKIETWSSGSLINKPIVSDGAHGIKTLDLPTNKIIKTNYIGALEEVEWNEENLLKTSNATNLLTLDEGKLLLSGPLNTVETWSSGGEHGSLLTRGAIDGSVEVKAWSNSGRIVITGSDGKLIELTSGVEGQMFVSGGPSANPGWVDAPPAYSHLPQRVLTGNPTAEDADAFKGLVAVILAKPLLLETDYRNNCVYYIGA